MLGFPQPHIFHLPIPGKLLVDRSEFASLTVPSLRPVSCLIADGTIRVKRVGSRILIPRDELPRFVEIEEPTNRR